MMSSTSTGLWWISLALGLAMVVPLSGCDGSSGFTEGFRVNDDYRREEFTQLRARATAILWVIDTSCSMMDEQESLAANFPSFIEFFVEREVPFRMGVTSTNIDEQETSGLDGRLAGSPPWLDSETDDVESQFVDRILLGIDPGHGRERGLHASYVALTDRLDDANAGFLRPEASLVVLVVSDEPDYSTIGNPDSDSFIGAQEYATWLDTLKADDDSHLSAIVGVGEQGLDDPEGCLHGDFQGQPNLEHGALRGDGYIEAAIATGGSIQSICDADWTSALYRLGTTSAGLRESFELSSPPIVESISVRLEGTLTDSWTYEPLMQSVVFDPLAIPESGQTVVITYRAEADQVDS